ncbi:MAG TPA: hypothetical protein VGR35_23405 [Tepidisphaeraceae bacterium]|nr:hypothetical protein [Tepidisphaeraceae bacterium]
MSWEAFRLTSKSPSELYDVLGPEGPDNLVRQFLTGCWNALPAGERSFAAWRRLAQEVYARNAAVWSRIKKPNPAAFFENLRPDPADGHLRQAFVLTWMMLPRTGGRDLKDARSVIDALYARNLTAWESDNATFTKGPRKAAKGGTTARAAKKSASKSKSNSKPKPKRIARK